MVETPGPVPAESSMMKNTAKAPQLKLVTALTDGFCAAVQVDRPDMRALFNMLPAPTYSADKVILMETTPHQGAGADACAA